MDIFIMGAVFGGLIISLLYVAVTTIRAINGHEKTAITIEDTQSIFIVRLWYLLTNPFLYLFKGKWRL